MNYYKLYTIVISVLILLLTAQRSQSQAQSDRQYRVVCAQDIPELLSDCESAKDSLGFVSCLNVETANLWSQGYLTARIDTIYSSQDTVIAELYIGDLYQFGDIQVPQKDMAMVISSGLKNVRWTDKVLSPSIIGDYTESLLKYLENNGYPFAKVRLDNTTIKDGILNANLLLDKKKYVPFDSLDIRGKVDIRRSFLDRYLNINVNDPYSREKINNISKRITDLPFAELDSTPLIRFENAFAKVQLFLKPKKASRFDFIIGVLPSTEAGERKFQITGEFTAEMYNRLGHGEYIYANFQRLKPETQELDLRFKYPYLFDLPLGIDTRFELYRNASEFLELIADAGILYQFDGAASLKMSWNNKSSRLIEIDTASILSTKRLPSKLDISYNGGGLEYSQSALDYRFNPSRGWSFRLGGTVGLKKIIRNSTIEQLSSGEVDFVQAYGTLKLNTFQTEATLSAAYYLPVFKVGAVKFGLEGGLQYNEEKIYDNERYRIGGNRLLRGFDEQSVLTDMYLVSTLEFRLLLDRNSYLSFPFVDFGLTRVQNNDEEVIWDKPVSIGMGINFATPAGIFNVSFAAGRRLGNPIDLGNTKIHFGYVSLF